MAMGKDYVPQNFTSEELAAMQESSDDEDCNDGHEKDDDSSMEDTEKEKQQTEDIRLFNNIASAKLSAAKQQHRHLQLEKAKREHKPIIVQLQHMQQRHGLQYYITDAGS